MDINPVISAHISVDIADMDDIDPENHWLIPIIEIVNLRYHIYVKFVDIVCMKHVPLSTGAR